MISACTESEKKNCDWHYCITMNKCIYEKNVLHKSDGSYIPKRVKALNRLGHKLECACCKSTKYLTFDHIIPLSKKGKDNNSNGQILCQRCNEIKGSKIISITNLKKLI